MKTTDTHTAFRMRLERYLRQHYPPAGRLLSLEDWQQYRRRHAPVLTAAQMRMTVTAAVTALQGLYVHMELKKARRGIDPVNQLRVLGDRIDTLEQLDSHAFHERMFEIFKLLGDVHTAYRRPEPYKSAIAFLPFLLGAYFDEHDTRRFVVTRMLGAGDELSCAPFGRDVEVVSWNGAPIQDAVRRSTDFEEGSNAPHDFALGVQFLTVRWLGASFEPESPWVDVGYRVRGDDTVRHSRFFWSVFVQKGGPRLLVADQARSLIFDSARPVERRERSLHIASQVIHAWRKKLFVPELEDAARREQRMLDAGERLVTQFSGFTGRRELQAFTRAHADLLTSDEPSAIPTLLPLFFEARIHTGRELLEKMAARTSSSAALPAAARAAIARRTFGYLGIRAFAIQDPERTLFRYELRRLLNLLPGDGLIVDIRENPGGSTRNAEESLQFLTPNPITPLPFRFIATALTRGATAESGSPFSEYGPSIETALATGAGFSAGRPITQPANANLAGQHYFGPVVLLTSAMTYSAADIFAAGFQDNGVGPVLGVDETTGAGGANCWFYLEEIARLVKVPKLPAGINLQVAVRQCARVGERLSGVPIEELGIQVPPEQLYRMRRDDVIDRRPWGLLLRAASMLAGLTGCDLETTIRKGRRAQEVDLTVTTRGIRRIDYYVDGRPATVDVRDNTTTFTVRGAGRVGVEIHGFDAEDVLVARHVQFFDVETERAKVSPAEASGAAPRRRPPSTNT